LSLARRERRTARRCHSQTAAPPTTLVIRPSAMFASADDTATTCPAAASPRPGAAGANDRYAAIILGGLTLAQGRRRCFPDERRRRDEGAPKERGGKAAPLQRPVASQQAQSGADPGGGQRAGDRPGVGRM